mgnify:FL=1
MLKSITQDVNKTYVGYTNNLKLRLTKHNNNKGAKATKGYKWKIIFKKRFLSKSKAMSYEYSLKKNRIKRSIILKTSNNEK